jgi:hypothetical protein
MESGSVALLLLLLLLTFAVTLPFGGWRSRCARFSLNWFLAVHLPIPLIFVMRTAGGFSWHDIPLFLASTLLGQFAGGRLLRPFPPAPPPTPEA